MRGAAQHSVTQHGMLCTRWLGGEAGWRQPPCQLSRRVSCFCFVSFCSGKALLDDFADEVADIVGAGGGEGSGIDAIFQRHRASQKWGADLEAQVRGVQRAAKAVLAAIAERLCARHAEMPARTPARTPTGTSRLARAIRLLPPPQAPPTPPTLRRPTRAGHGCLPQGAALWRRRPAPEGASV